MAAVVPPRRNGGVNGPDDLLGLRAENQRLRDANQRLSAQVLQLEGRVSSLEQQLARGAAGLTLEQLSAALIGAVADADRLLAAEPGEARYSIASLECDLKGSFAIAGSSLALQPADPGPGRSPQSLSEVRFSVARVPADIAAMSGG